MADRAWVKLWASYWTSLSHADIGPDALLVGCVLMSSVRWNPGDLHAWAVTEAGRPIPISVFAARAQLTPKRTLCALLVLEQAGTAKLRDGTTWGLPNFGRYQETADAAKKRRQRGQSRDTVHDSPREGEADADADADAEFSLRSVAREVKPKRTKPVAEPSPQVDRILARLNELRSEGVPGSNLGDGQWVRRLLLARPQAEPDALLVLEYTAHEARQTGEWKHLNSSTPFRLEHFEGRLARAQAWQAKCRHGGPKLENWTPPGGITADELDARLGEDRRRA